MHSSSGGPAFSSYLCGAPTQVEMELNQLTSQIIGAAIEVHREIGPGLLESTYEECLCKEFELNGLGFVRQKEIPVNLMTNAK